VRSAAIRASVLAPTIVASATIVLPRASVLSWTRPPASSEAYQKASVAAVFVSLLERDLTAISIPRCNLAPLFDGKAKIQIKSMAIGNLRTHVTI
jgi:hypothetical protein